MYCIYICTYVGIPLKPVVAVQPEQVINLTANNLNLSMQCGHYSKDFIYQWEKKNEMVHLRAQGLNSYQLIITNLAVEDSGEYRCSMSNSTGKIFSDYSLVTIKGLPSLILMIYILLYMTKHSRGNFHSFRDFYSTVNVLHQQDY